MGDGLLMPSHLILLAVLVLIFFGPSKLPEIGRSLGHGIRGFRDGLNPPAQDRPDSKPGVD